MGGAVRRMRWCTGEYVCNRGCEWLGWDLDWSVLAGVPRLRLGLFFLVPFCFRTYYLLFRFLTLEIGIRVVSVAGFFVFGVRNYGTRLNWPRLFGVCGYSVVLASYLVFCGLGKIARISGFGSEEKGDKKRKKEVGIERL